MSAASKLAWVIIALGFVLLGGCSNTAVKMDFVEPTSLVESLRDAQASHYSLFINNPGYRSMSMGGEYPLEGLRRHRESELKSMVLEEYARNSLVSSINQYRSIMVSGSGDALINDQTDLLRKREETYFQALEAMRAGSKTSPHPEIILAVLGNIEYEYLREGEPRVTLTYGYSEDMRRVGATASISFVKRVDGRRFFCGDIVEVVLSHEDSVTDDKLHLKNTFGYSRLRLKKAIAELSDMVAQHLSGGFVHELFANEVAQSSSKSTYDYVSLKGELWNQSLAVRGEDSSVGLILLSNRRDKSDFCGRSIRVVKLNEDLATEVQALADVMNSQEKIVKSNKYFQQVDQRQQLRNHQILINRIKR